MTSEISVSRLLEPDERLIWSGKPDPLRYSLNKGAPTVLLGVIFFGFALFPFSIARDDGGIVIPLMFSFPFLLIGLGLLVSPLWQYFRATWAVYALTDRRVIIYFPGMLSRRVTVPLNQIPFVEIRKPPNSIGDVLFQRGGISRGEGFSIRRDGFIAIRDVDAVGRLLRAAIGKPEGIHVPGLQALQTVANPPKIKRAWLFTLSIVYGLLLFPGPGLFILLFSTFVFAAPGSEKNPTTIFLGFSVLILPLTLLIACIGGLRNSLGEQTIKKNQWGKIFAVLPLLNLGLIVVAFMLIQLVCDGKFACR